MKITIAKDAGYCFGVRDAVNMAYDSAEKHGDVYMLGSIVHNEKVVNDLKNAGAKIVKSLDDVPKESPILFRAHGTVPKLWDEAKEMKMNIIDATCPLVYEIHQEVKKLAKDGRRIIVVGDHGHDEVIAIANQVENAIVISSPKEALKLKKMKKAGVVSQSTQAIENVQEKKDTFFEFMLPIIRRVNEAIRKERQLVNHFSRTVESGRDLSERDARQLAELMIKYRLIGDPIQTQKILRNYCGESTPSRRRLCSPSLPMNRPGALQDSPGKATTTSGSGAGPGTAACCRQTGRRVQATRSRLSIRLRQGWPTTC